MIIFRNLSRASILIRYARNLNESNIFQVSKRNFMKSAALYQCTDKTTTGKNIDNLGGTKEREIPSLLSQKFEAFKEENAPLILDLEEERRKVSAQQSETVLEQSEASEDFCDLDLTRGQRGVFDVEQLVTLLQSDGALDLFVAELPREIRYAEHIVIVTGRSARHRKALATLVRRVFKKKSLPSEHIPRIEGDHVGGNNMDWLALDLGNIVLHIFARGTREKYDLESLWSLGVDHDLQCLKAEDPLIELLTSHSVYLGDLEPAEPNIPSEKKNQ